MRVSALRAYNAGMAKQRNGSPRISQSGKPHEDAGSLEANIVRLAMTGKLAEAGRNAIRVQKERGIPVTFIRGGKIIKQHSDGREEVLGTVERPKYRVPRGVAVLRKK
jgi:hypothetical protein